VSGPIKIAIIGDGSKAKKEAKDVGDTYKSVFSKLGDSVRVGVSKSFGGLRASASSGVGDLLGAVKGLPALAVGAAVGGSLVVGFTKAMDLEDARGLLQAQLGLTAPESAKAGKIAGDLYKQAYGDSIQDVNETLKTVFQSGLAGIGDSATKIEGVTQSAFTLSKVMGEETLPITRAVAQMLKTGLAKNAKEAFDLLTRGQQLGINKSEDLLDTFNEYGTQFRKLGLSGADALGLINQLLQGGARDSDVAADAIKEFSIRAIDGSTTTAQGFKAIGLNAKEMSKQIGAGGPAARTAFGQVLTALNGIEDPVKRNLAGVALFGTQWEDLGGAIGKANLGTAAKSLGDVAGATARANAATTTTSSKLSQVARTIQFTLTDAIAKYALPKLNEFVTWFQGPGKFAIVEWGIDAGQSVLGFLDKMLGGLSAAIPAMSKFAAVGLLAAASMVAVANPSQALALVQQARDMDKWGESAKKGIGQARTELQGWGDALGKAKTRVQFEADISDLDAKITAARNELKDPKLTATRRAQLQANITQLEAAKTKAVKQLGDPKLIATRTAQLSANKAALDSQIAKAKAALASKDLTRERRATLNADISRLQAQRRAAQADLNSLHGVTVPVTISVTAKVNAAQIRNKVADQLARYGLEPRATGGPVVRGRTYLVGENGPEILTMGGTSGFITPTQKLAPSLLDSAVGGGGAPVIINVYALAGGPEVGRAAVDAIREYERFNGAGWRN
jgi:cob(I)alamin adenosyltransferase